MTMESLECLPFQYPTTVYLVDDSEDFLYNFGFQLDERLPVRSFVSPVQALKVINAAGVDPRVESRDFVMEHKQHFGHPTLEHVIGLDLSAIYLQMYRKDRFGEASVLVVDYQMGEMNGLDLCRELIDSPIKKILLTGKAGADTAVEAFNEGLIDRYVAKNEPNTLRLVHDYIAELEREYFKEASSLLTRALSVDAPSLLQDNAFVEFFTEFRKTNNIVEHYLVANPTGFLMLDQYGKGSLMLIVSEEELAVQHRTALDEGGPKELLQALSSGEFVPFFSDTDGLYRQGLTVWKEALHPSSRLEGDNGVYYYAVLDSTQPYNTSKGTIYSLADFLSDMHDEKIT